MTATTHACDDCLRRTDLIAALAGRLDIEWRRRTAPSGVLSLPAEQLLELGTPAIRKRWAGFSAAAARGAIEAAGLVAVCRCGAAYPQELEDLPDPPAVVHVAGHIDALAPDERVGIVGARAASAYGEEVARELGRAITVAGVPVVSGLAMGIDAMAHAGAIAATADATATAHVGASAGRADSAALAAAKPAEPLARATETGTPTRPIAVLAGGADRPYPAHGRRLHHAVRSVGAIVSEMPPGFGVHRWAFVARNRIIAALSTVLVVVEAAERSGSLTTADFAAGLGRTVSAVPGRVTARTAAGTNGLIRDGAPLVRNAKDVLDLLADVSGRARVEVLTTPSRPAGLDAIAHHVLDLVENGRGTLAELAGSPDQARAVLRALGELEARGAIVRGFGGRYERAARTA